MITLASVQAARHVMVSIATEAKREIERDAIYWMCMATDIESATTLRMLAQDFTEHMDYENRLSTWEALKKNEVRFCLQRIGASPRYLELEEVTE